MEKLIAIKSRGLKLIKLCASLDDNLSFKLYRTEDDYGTDTSVDLSFIKFNKINWEVKLQRVFTELGDNDPATQKEYMREKIEEVFNNSSFEKELPYQEISLQAANLNSNNEHTAKMLEQLEYFNNMPIPKQTIGFLEPYLEGIEKAEPSKSQVKLLYKKYAEPISEVEEYVLYVGDSTKFLGKVGKIVGHRDDVAPNLVEFKGVKPDNSAIKFWTKEENMVRFCI